MFVSPFVNLFYKPILQLILGIRKARDGFCEGLQFLKFRRRHHVGLDGGGERGEDI